ncbi:hypothetical protein [Luteolibacter sp. LG18]|uniref:hypothetical protein n=1 Tax=Luteolibacter sp. LG18 TaxID=2819286 RepID=UPI0030C750DF
MLWLAVLLMALAQCLPWEHVPLKFWRSESIAEGETATKQVLHRWRFVQSPILPPSTGHSVWYGVIDSRIVSAQKHPKAFPTYQIPDLWFYARSLIDQRPNLAWLVSSPFPLMLLVIWPVAFIALIAMPFLAGPLGHSRATLWLFRALAAIMLVWLIRNLFIAFTGISALQEYERIGSGYYLTLAALVVEIVGLFLIPDSSGMHPPARDDNLLHL